MYELNGKENFKKEVIGLMIKLDKRIKILSEKISFIETAPSKIQSSKLNQLKLHRYKMKEVLDLMEIIYDENWRKSRDTLQERFQDAEKLLV